MIIQGVTLTNVGYVKDSGPPIVTSGLKMYYDPSNSSSYNGGSTIYDLSGNGINGTVVGSPTDSGNYFTLNGTSQYIMSGDISSAKGASNSHTVEVWVKPTAIGAGWIDRDSTGPLNTGYRSTGLEFYNVGPFTICNTMLYSLSTGVTRTGGGTTPLNNWYQVVRTYNGTSVTAYVNKVAASPTTIAWYAPPTWYIGFGAYIDVTYYSTGAYFTGNYGVMRVYNRALSSTEVTQNYNATKTLYGL